jgi:hypothetical protein
MWGRSQHQPHEVEVVIQWFVRGPHHGTMVSMVGRTFDRLMTVVEVGEVPRPVALAAPWLVARDLGWRERDGGACVQ